MSGIPENVDLRFLAILPQKVGSRLDRLTAGVENLKSEAGGLKAEVGSLKSDAGALNSHVDTLSACMHEGFMRIDDERFERAEAETARLQADVSVTKSIAREVIVRLTLIKKGISAVEHA